VALTDGEQTILDRLESRLAAAQPEILRFDAYYEGTWRLAQLGLAVPEELACFVTLVNWPRLAVDSLEERIDLEGFRLPGEADADEDLWRIWQANGLDGESQLGHLDALALKRSYVTVGTNEADASTPLVTVESPQEMICEVDPRTRAVKHALRKFKDEDGFEFATLYLPNSTVWLDQSRRASGRLGEVERDDHALGAVPVVPLVNRPRTKRRDGVSEMADIIPLTDAAARALTNAQVATELLATPQRYVLGATAADFVDQDGTALTTWETYLGHFLALANSDAKMGQFAAADLGNFTKIVEHYAQLVAGVTGLPMRYLGQNTANPPSAAGIRADEARIVKRAERRERAWGESWEQVMRLVRRFVDGRFDPELASMETLWRDPATPTRAQAADAVVKLHAEGILPTEAAREDLGYSATRRAKLRQQDLEQAQDPILSLLKTPPASASDARPVGGAVPAAASRTVGGEAAAGAFLG
jgi:hypothetical protein